jgi:nitrite reductase/ring-hydroxylating ferredoxin subunit
MTGAGREARIPVAEAPAEGTVRMLDVGGHRVGLYRVGAELHALADRCPHRGAPLCAGTVATPVELGAGEVVVGTPNSIVRCPWHKWEFEISTGRSLVEPRLRVRRYAVRVDGAEVVVSLDRRAGPAGASG